MGAIWICYLSCTYCPQIASFITYTKCLKCLFKAYLPFEGCKIQSREIPKCNTKISCAKFMLAQTEFSTLLFVSYHGILSSMDFLADGVDQKLSNLLSNCKSQILNSFQISILELRCKSQKRSKVKDFYHFSDAHDGTEHDVYT